jgi:tight adherence protein B
MDMTTLLIAAFMGFVVVGGLGFVFAGGDRSAASAKRMTSVAGGRSADKPRSRTAAEVAGVRRKQIVQTLKTAEKQERKAKVTVEARIRQAGLQNSVSQFWIASGLFGLVVFLIVVFMKGGPLAALGLAFTAAFGLPRWVLGFLAKRRMKKFTEEFPNATDIIVRGIKSGLPVHDCMKVIGKESPEPLGAEFRKLVESVSMGANLDHCLEKMYERMPTPEVRFFAIVLSIQQKTGGNLAEALNNLSTVLRARKLMKEKIKAMSGEAVASAFIIGSLPPGIVAIMSTVSPTYLLPLWEDPRGHGILLFAAVWMGTGIFVMRRMINFKF